ncbi:MAG TPA: hypothetical protein VG713_14385 [Pirellulales bacterium]|nr:hypothetical protein [Pirellulales bacterium]
MDVANSRQSGLDPNATQALQDLYLRLQPIRIARRFWRDLLSAKDRQALGNNFTESFSKNRDVVHHWAHLRNCSGERAILELANQFDLVDDETLRWLVRELGERPVKKIPGRSARTPRWDKARGVLELDGTVIRKVRANARRLRTILETFETSSWPSRIDDPLSGGPDAQRLREAVADLNKGLKQIRFRADGTGMGINWELRPVGRTRKRSRR